jgi:hypothetical protein
VSPLAQTAALALLALTACTPATPLERAAEAMPDRIGPFRAEGPAERSTAHGRQTYARRYKASGREASLRAVDVTAHPDIRRSFQTALSIHEDTLEALSRAAVIDGERGTLSWSRETGESSVEVLVREDLLLSFNVWPADVKEEAATRFPAEFVHAAREATETR